MASASNFRTSLRRHNVIYTRATFWRTKAFAKWSVTATTLSRVTSCIQIRAQLRLFQVKAMFKQHVNLMIWTWSMRLQTASRNEFPCKNTCKRMQHSSTIGGNYSMQWLKVWRSWRLQMCFRRLLCVRIKIDQLLSNNSMFVGLLYEDKPFALRALDLIFFTTELQTMNYYSTIHC